MKTKYIDNNCNDVTVKDILNKNDLFTFYFVNKSKKQIIKKVIQYKVYDKETGLTRGGIINNIERLNEVISFLNLNERIEFFEEEIPTEYHIEK